MFLVEVFGYFLFFVAFMVAVITKKFGALLESKIAVIITKVLGVILIAFAFIINPDLFLPKMLVFTAVVIALLFLADDLYDE